MSYPYQRLFLDIQLARKRLGEALGPARGVADVTTDRPWLAEPYPTGSRLTEPFYDGITQEAARPAFCGVAIEQMRPTVGRSQAEFGSRNGTNMPVEEFQMLLR